MNNNQLFNDHLSEVFADALRKQGGFARRKDSIREATGMVLQLANLTVGLQAGLPAWAIGIIAAIIGVLQIVHAATSEAPLAPSQERKLIAQARKKELPDFGDASVLNVLMNIADAVNNQRAKERGIDGYGPAAVEVSPDLEKATSLDDLRKKLAINAK